MSVIFVYEYPYTNIGENNMRAGENMREYERTRENMRERERI